jgi:hypothetical protein
MVRVEEYSRHTHTHTHTHTSTHTQYTHTCTHTYTHEDIDTYIRTGWARSIETTKLKAMLQNEPVFRIHLRKMRQRYTHTHTMSLLIRRTCTVSLYENALYQRIQIKASVCAKFKSINAVPIHVKKYREIIHIACTHENVSKQILRSRAEAHAHTDMFVCL